MTTSEMTEDESKRFDRYSIENASQVENAFASCGCQAYVDVYTYNRWQAQGFQVVKGQKAVKISTARKVEDKKTGEDKMIFKTSFVFCKHQVEEIK